MPRGDWIVPPWRVGCNRVSHGLRAARSADASRALGDRRRRVPTGGSEGLRNVRGSRPSATASSGGSGARRVARTRASTARRTRRGVQAAERRPVGQADALEAAAVRRGRVAGRPHQLRRLVGDALGRASAPQTTPRSPGTARARYQLSGPSIRSNRYDWYGASRIVGAPAAHADPPAITSIACSPGAAASSRAWVDTNSARSAASASSSASRPMPIAAGSSTSTSGQPAAASAAQLARQRGPPARG